MIPSRPDPVNTGVGIVNHYTRPFPSALLLHHLSNCTMKRKTILPVAVLSLATTLPQYAEASRRAEQDSLSTHRLEEVQVTATRASEKTPMTFTNVSKGRLQKNNLGLDIPYLLLQTPSVVATSDAGIGIGYTALRVRGVDASGINVMTNGVPLNDSESQGVFWANMPNFSASVQDAQLQRGVGTSSNGAGAFGASLNLRTDHFLLTPSASVSLLGGAFNTFRREVHASTGRIAGHWALEARLGKTTTDGYVDRSGTDGRSYFVQGGYFGEKTILKFLAFGGKQHTGIAWNGLSAKDEAKYGRTYNSAGHINPGSTPQDARYRYNTDNYEQNHYQLQLSQQLTPRTTLSVTGHYTRGYGFTDELRTGRKLVEYGLQNFVQKDASGKDVTVKKVTLLRSKYLDNHFAGLITSLAYQDDRIELTGGIAGNHYLGDHYGTRSITSGYPYAVDPTERYYSNEAKKTDLSAFVKLNYELARGLNVFADVQYRFIDYRIKGTTDHLVEQTKKQQHLDLRKTFRFLNPKAGLFFRFAPAHHLYASVAVAHREPNRSLYTDATPKDYPKAERLIDYELGYGFRSRTLSAGLNLYYMDYKDQIVANGKLSDVGGILKENVAKSYRMGVELNASWLVVSSLRWDAAFALSQSRIKDYTYYASVIDNLTDFKYQPGLYSATLRSTPIAFSPSIVMSNTLSYGYGGFEVALTHQLVGKQYLDNLGREDHSLPSYHTTSLRLGYELPVRFVKGWSVQLQVNNLFNAKYSNNGYVYDFAKAQTGGDYTKLMLYPQAGIHALVGTTISL